MPNVSVVDKTGNKVGEIALADSVFGIEPNATVLHAAVVNYLANQRQGTQSTLTRSEVSGGRQEAVETEGHWPCQTGFHPRPSVDSRRHRFCPEAQGLFLCAEQESEEAGHEVRPFRQGSGR